MTEEAKHKTTPAKVRVKSMLFVAIAAILWSTAGLAIKSVPWNPIAIAGVRSAIATVVLIIYWLVQHKSLPPLPTKRKAFGALNYMFLVLLFIGANKLTTAANAILLQFTSPIWVMILASIFLKEKIMRKDILAVVVVFFGMGLFFVGDLDLGGMIGNVLAILCGVGMAIMVVSLKGVQTGSPLEIIFWGNIFAVIVSLPFCTNLVITPESLIGISFLGVFQLGISYIFFAKGIQGVSALEGILIPVLEPLLNPIWVYLFIGEQPSGYAIIGGVIVIMAVVLRSIPKRAVMTRDGTKDVKLEVKSG